MPVKDAPSNFISTGAKGRIAPDAGAVIQTWLGPGSGVGVGGVGVVGFTQAVSNPMNKLNTIPLYPNLISTSSLFSNGE